MYPPPRVARTALGEIVRATLATSALDLTTVRASARDRACYACHLCARAQSALRSSAARAEMTDLDNEIIRLSRRWRSQRSSTLRTLPTPCTRWRPSRAGREAGARCEGRAWRTTVINTHYLVTVLVVRYRGGEPPVRGGAGEDE